MAIIYDWLKLLVFLAVFCLVLPFMLLITIVLGICELLQMAHKKS